MHTKIDFLGIKVGVLTIDGLIEKVLEYARIQKRKFITYLNAHCVNVSFSDPAYKDILNSADIVYADGISIVFSVRLFGNSLPERITDLDFFDRLVGYAVAKEISFYLLGGKPFVGQKVAERLRKTFPDIRILGSRHGYFNDSEEEGIIQEINTLKPNILLVAMGVPKQEKWIYKHLNKLEVNVCWAIGTFNDLTGLEKRAPRWMLKAGLEWLYRLYQEPGRLWRRYLIGNFVFIYRVFESKIKSLFFQKFL